MSDIFDFLQNIPIATAVDPYMFVVLTVLLACGRHGLFRRGYLRNTATVDIKHFGNTVITESMYVQCFHYVITASGRRKHRTSISLLAFTSMIAALSLKPPDNNTTRSVGVEVSAVGE
jgi:hypothetical protein